MQKMHACLSQNADTKEKKCSAFQGRPRSWRRLFLRGLVVSVIILYHVLALAAPSCGEMVDGALLYCTFTFVATWTHAPLSERGRSRCKHQTACTFSNKLCIYKPYIYVQYPMNKNQHASNVFQLFLFMSLKSKNNNMYCTLCSYFAHDTNDLILLIQ